MLLSPILALLAFALPPQQQPAALSTAELIDTAHKLALDEGWPIDQKGYTLDPMQPMRDEDFYSIGLYRNAHLLRMYSIQRQTGDIVDFMHGCDLLQFDDVKPLQTRIRKASGSSALPIDRLAATVGCPKLNVVNTRWVH
ncbi:hypothetical protein [Granulicella arctica]|uniref:Uncharacterized protein n=1 Tax=Granulicella arctica TaxID=940613 RepID=A0A7Y9PH02_9BACT|nr:hypothetical protein [Granulicella arctica]NYF79730.1 hypothetical protein [Granulicella arctica]